MGIFSAVTGIFGASQTASAYSNAASEQGRGYRQGADTINRTVDAVNPALAEDARAAGAAVEEQGNNAGVAVVNAGVDARRRGDAAAGEANALLNPYIDAGKIGVNRLSELVQDGGKFTFSEDDPSYQWRMQQGQKALERNRAAAGMSQSGGTLKALTRYAQGLASTEYGAAFDRFERSRGRQFSEASTLASGGLQASGAAGNNLTRAAEYGGTAVMNAEQSAGTFRTDAAKYSGNARIRAGENIGQNNMFAGTYRAGAEQGIADANASSFLGRAGAWNGALSAIGGAADGFMAGGFSGGGGFKMGDAFRGYSRTPMTPNTNDRIAT